MGISNCNKFEPEWGPNMGESAFRCVNCCHESYEHWNFAISPDAFPSMKYATYMEYITYMREKYVTYTLFPEFLEEAIIF